MKISDCGAMNDKFSFAVLSFQTPVLIKIRCYIIKNKNKFPFNIPPGIRRQLKKFTALTIYNNKHINLLTRNNLKQ